MGWATGYFHQPPKVEQRTFWGWHIAYLIVGAIILGLAFTLTAGFIYLAAITWPWCCLVVAFAIPSYWVGRAIIESA